MAGEKKGKAYEALVHVALHDLVAAKKLAGPLHWNITPKEMSIEPDFLTGQDPNSPTSILLLTHSGSAKESEKKMWRNLGELVEAKTVLPELPRVYALTFGVIKADLEPIQQHAFDHFAWVRQSTHPWADELDGFVSSCISSFPKGKDAQLGFVQAELNKATTKVKSAYQQLKTLLETVYQIKSSALDKMWGHHRSRSLPAVPGARNTSIRRGASKLYLFPDHQEAYRSFKTSAGFKKPVGHLAPLALVERRPGGWFPAKDGDVLSCVKLLNEKDCLALFSGKATTSGFRLQAAKVQESAMLSLYADWCRANWKSLTSQANMKKTLLALHANPSSFLSLPTGCSAPEHVWIMDVLGAIIRAGSNKSQEFGFSSFAKHPQAKSSMIGNMDVGTWTSCFMNQFFTRKAGFNPPPAAIDFTALVLSDFAKQAAVASVTPAELERHYLTKEYEAVYLAHRGFEPLWGLISGQMKDANQIRIRTCYAEAAGLSGISGNCTLAKVKNTLINWQSAHGSHTNDKKKELCGRAIGLRYHWNGKEFVRRPGVEKIILVLDGTWKQADLNALLRAGWDEIYYPDEMDQLAKAIV
jgi:hypothetical protein